MALHGLAAIACIISALTLLVKLLISIAVICSLIYNIKKTNTTHILTWRAGNNWIIYDNPQQSRGAELTAIDFLSRWLVIITLNDEHRHTHRYIVPYDSLGKDCFRLLRVRLRIDGDTMLNPDRHD